MNRPKRRRGLVLFLFVLGACGKTGSSGFAATAVAAPVTSTTGATITSSSTVAVVSTSPTFDVRLGISCCPSVGLDPASAASRACDLDAIAKGGFHYLRCDFTWQTIEPTKGTFDFAGFDALVDDAASRGIEVIAILCYGNPWATHWGFLNDGAFPPDDPADFGAFAGATVAHFKGRVKRFEVWNEPNIGLRFWKPFQDPGAYGDLLAAAHAAALAANPDVIVSSAGTFYEGLGPAILPGTIDFGEAVYAHRADAAKTFDAFSYHPYRYPFVSPEAAIPFALPGMEPLEETVDQVNGLLARHGDSWKPVWITEAGWHTALSGFPFPGVPEDDQARFLVRATVEAIARDVEVFCWYTLRDGPNETTWQEDAFGVFAYSKDPVASPPRAKPAYAAHQTVAAVLSGTRFDQDVRVPLGLPTDARAFRFRAPGAFPVYVLYTTDGTPSVTATVALEPGATVAESVAIDGAVTALTTSTSSSGAATVSVPLTSDPVYVRMR